MKQQRSTNDAHWSFYFCAPSLYFQHEDGILCIDSLVQASSGEGPYDGISADIGDVDCAVFVRDAVGWEVWEKEKERGRSSYFTLDRNYEILEANKAS